MRLLYHIAISAQFELMGCDIRGRQRLWRLGDSECVNALGIKLRLLIDRPIISLVYF